MLYEPNNEMIGIAIRELIQNGRDSIRARKHFDKELEGKITIKIENSSSDNVLIVEDNGIGMSERILEVFMNASEVNMCVSKLFMNASKRFGRTA